MKELEKKYARHRGSAATALGRMAARARNVEFWQGRRSRLHDRLRYRRGDDGGWIVERLRREEAGLKSNAQAARPGGFLLAAALRAQSDGVFIADAKASNRGIKDRVRQRQLLRDDRPLRRGTHRACITAVYTSIQPDVITIVQWLGAPRAHRPAADAAKATFCAIDGGTIHASWSFNPLVRKGRVTHVVATYRDTTEKRRLQEALGPRAALGCGRPARRRRRARLQQPALGHQRLLRDARGQNRRSPPRRCAKSPRFTKPAATPPRSRGSSSPSAAASRSMHVSSNFNPLVQENAEILHRDWSARPASSSSISPMTWTMSAPIPRNFSRCS